MVIRTAIALMALLVTIVAMAQVWAAESMEPVDLNSATTAQLMRLPGVGLERAKDIVQQRAIRPFRRTSDLLRIKGIGRRTYFRLKPLVRVGPPPGTPKKGDPQVCPVQK